MKSVTLKVPKKPSAEYKYKLDVPAYCSWCAALAVAIFDARNQGVSLEEIEAKVCSILDMAKRLSAVEMEKG